MSQSYWCTDFKQKRMYTVLIKRESPCRRTERESGSVQWLDCYPDFLSKGQRLTSACTDACAGARGRSLG